MTNTHKSPSHTHSEHGTIGSYIIGFVLSLIFTFIPYYLVVNQVISGTELLIAILGFGIIQMMIQIFFFLHLGRGPKPLYNVFFFGVTFTAILVVVGGSVFIMNNLYHNMAPADIDKKLIEKEGIYQISGEKTGACQGKGVNHKVTIRDGEVQPFVTVAKICDTLTFVNEDDRLREMAFGAHPRHDSYGGETEVPVRKGRAKTITLNQPGDYLFHDHLDPATYGQFIVKQ